MKYSSIPVSPETRIELKKILLFDDIGSYEKLLRVMINHYHDKQKISSKKRKKRAR